MLTFRAGSSVGLGVGAPLPSWTPLEPPKVLQAILAIDEEQKDEKDEEEKRND